MTMDGFDRVIQAIKDTMMKCLDENVSFEQARVLMVCKCHLTMGEATDRLEMYERIANVRLER